MKNSLFVATLKGKEENLKNFMTSKFFSFEKDSPGKITILRSFNYVVSEIKESENCYKGEKEIYSIEMKADEELLNKNLTALRHAAAKYNITICFIKDNLKEMRTEFISINNNWDINYNCEYIDLLSL